MINRTLGIIVLAIFSSSMAFANSDTEITELEKKLNKAKVVKAFKESVKNKNWKDLLAICSNKIKKAYEKSENKDNFFKSILPIKAINQCSSWQKKSTFFKEFSFNKFKQENSESYSLTIKNENSSYSINWSYKLFEKDGTFNIDFSTKPFLEEITQLFKNK